MTVTNDLLCAEVASLQHTVAYRLMSESGEQQPPPLLASARRQSTEQARIPLLPRELVPPGQGWDTVARGGWGWLALPLPVLYLFCG